MKGPFSEILRMNKKKARRVRKRLQWVSVRVCWIIGAQKKV